MSVVIGAFQSSSGNRAEIELDGVHGAIAVSFMWERTPPSEADMQEARDVFTARIAPLLPVDLSRQMDQGFIADNERLDKMRDGFLKLYGPDAPRTKQ